MFLGSYLQFQLLFGGFMCFAALVLAVTVKDSGIRLGWKIAAPTALVVLGCITPYSVAQMMGSKRAELLTWVAHDTEKTVDLLLQENGRTRLYSVPMGDSMRETVKQAAKVKGDGGRVYFVAPASDGEMVHMEQDDLPKKGA